MHATSASAGAPPSGVNVVREDVRSLRTHGASAPVECQCAGHRPHSLHSERRPQAQVPLALAAV